MKPLWEPPADYIPRTEMSRYMGWIGDRLGRQFNSYAELYDWSINSIEAFWQSIWEFMEIVHSREFGEVRTGSKIWNSVWFEGARLNFADGGSSRERKRTASEKAATLVAMASLATQGRPAAWASIRARGNPS